MTDVSVERDIPALDAIARAARQLQYKAVLEAHDLVKTFSEGDGALTVLKGVSLSVQTGDFIAITGSSGSGKSTLLHILGGLDKPTSGSVLLMGEQLDKADDATLSNLRNLHLGFVYQFHHLMAEFSALENTAMPLLLRGVAPAVAAREAAAMLAQVGLTARATHKPAALSGGERQRVAIARALVTRPACVLADEPTGNLDQDTAQAVQDLLLELNASLGTSVIVVTHDRDFAARAPRQYRMTHGHLE